MQLNASDLTLSRQHPQSTELFLSVFQPNTVLSAMVSGTVADGAMSIPFSTVSGSYLSVEAGMTLLIGTSAGARDVGKLRVRSITSTSISVAENSGISWTGKYLTVLRYWEVWPIFPRIITDPANTDNVIFYKDYDIAYTNQNTILGSFPCAGPHRAGFVGDTFYYSSSGTTNLVGSALSYDWAFEGGNVTGSSSATPGNITYNTPGHYVTRLKVTAANGAVDTTYRYVSVYNKPTSSTNVPIRNWSVDSFSGARTEGGYNTSIKIIDEVPPELHDGDVVVMWSEDWYGGTKKSIGGNSENNSTIFFVGHIQNGSIRYDYKTSEMDFQVGSITDVMKVAEGFAISVESKPSPSKWFELLDLDGRRAIYHFLKWHSTVLSLADVQFMGTDRKTQFFDSDRQSIFDAIDNYMRTALLGNVVTDRQGKLWAEVGAYTYSNPTGSFPPIQTIDKSDWIGEPTIQQRLIPEISFMEFGGVAYSGSTTGTFGAFLSQVPGTTPSYRGKVENVQGLTLDGQTQLNALAGNVFTNRNTKYPTIELPLAGNFRQFDIAPLVSIDINIAASDTNIGATIHAPYLIDSMSWNYSSSNKTMLPSMTLGSLVNGASSGATVTIPDIPDAGGFSDFGGGGNFNFNPGAMPAYLSGFGSQPIGQWNGNAYYGIPTDKFWVNLPMSSQEFNYLTPWASGTYYGATGSGYSENPILLPSNGIYLIQTNFAGTMLTNTLGGYYVSVGFGVGGTYASSGQVLCGAVHYYLANQTSVQFSASKVVIANAGDIVVPKIGFTSISTSASILVTTFIEYLRSYP